MEQSTVSDKGVGLTVLFALLGVGGAVVMFSAGMAHDQLLSGWGFAGAMVAGTLAIAATHVYG